MIKKCLAVLGGTTDKKILNAIYKAYPDFYVIAADKGLEALDGTGIMPDRILGDFDSVSAGILEKYIGSDIETFNPVKDFTDGEAVVDLAVELLNGNTEAAGAGIDTGCKGFFFDPSEVVSEYDLVILGATGSRLDHTTANISLLKKACDKNVKAVILDEKNMISLYRPGRITVPRRPVKTFLSLMPLGDSVEELNLNGFKYDADNIRLVQGSSLGISNEVTGEKGNISFGAGYLLVMETVD